MPGYITHSVRLLAVPILLAGVAGGVAPGTASAAQAGSAGTAAPFRVNGTLSGVAATSAGNAWAVGSSGSLTSPKALIVHWNGTGWKQMPSPAPAGSALAGVAATSATNAWAVGSTSTGKALILRWNGTAWAQVSSPRPGAFSGLSGVAAVSASSAWAVGETGNGTGGSVKTLILHWNGTAWKQVSSPSPAGGAGLSGVAADSASSAWAVGFTGTITKTLILRWNGTAWKQVPSPSPEAPNPDTLRGVATGPAGSAWAVGCTTCATASGFNAPLIEGWNGKAWAQTPTPGLGAPGGILAGVAAISATSAWAVGGTASGVGASEVITTLIARWNGTKWTRVPSPTPGGRAGLSGVAAVSATSAWAVGESGTGKTLIERWNGTAWKVS
jgi:hypothetical protein